MDIDEDVRAARFGARMTFHDSPLTLEALERAAVKAGVSTAALVRLCVRLVLAEVEESRSRG